MLHRLATVPLLRRLWAGHPWLLVLLWGLMQAVFLLKFHGPHVANDSPVYLGYAANVVRHGGHYVQEEPVQVLSPELPNPSTYEYEHMQRYVVYGWFLAFWFALGAGLWGVVLGQLALSGVAAVALYGAVRRLVPGRRWPAALATAAFVLWPDIQQFNVFILTESLFVSLSVLVLAALVRLPGGGWRAWLALGLALVLATKARPNGFVLAGAALLAGLTYLWQRPSRQLFWVAVAALGLTTPLGVLWLNYQLKSFLIVETYARGELIFGSQQWLLHPTAPLTMPPAGTGQVPRILHFAAHNPVFLLKLMLGKLFVFVSGLKPHYSLGHRVANVLVLWPCYWLAVCGARQRSIWKPWRVFLAAVPVLQAAVVMLTVDDWDVRFQVPVLPFVFVLAALGLLGNRVVNSGISNR